MPDVKEKEIAEKEIAAKGGNFRLHNLVPKATKIQEESLPGYISGITQRKYLLSSYSERGEEVLKATSRLGHSLTYTMSSEGAYKALEEGTSISFH